MPPKAKPATPSSHVYVVTHHNGVDSVHASADSANERASAMKVEDGLDGSIKVELHELKGGSVQILSIVEGKTTPKVKTPQKEEVEAPKVNITAKKTKTPAEQRAMNAAKPDKTADSDLPDNIKKLLVGTGDVLSGLTIVVTGIPPILGRKNAEKLVTGYGGKLTKSLSKNTNYVVVGNDAGPKKLEQIEGLGIETWDEDSLIDILEKGGIGISTKRGAEENEKLVTQKKHRK
jgi:NAD-dependent DNA ligase